LSGYLAWRPVTAVNLGFHEYDGKLINMSKASIDQELSLLKDFEQKLITTDTSALSEKNYYDYRILRNAQNYLWSDQSTGPQLTVSQPGLYSLNVTDSNLCVGHDSILIAQKQCIEGLFVPNAFTPNGDGRNDSFRAYLSGNINGFRFTIYNRWGSKVFETKTVGQGWDGTYNGTAAGTGTFIWYCRYQLDGQPEKIKKGTVMLLR
jgi:gliding motility-associated-like protein